MPENTQENEAIKDNGVTVEPDAVVNEILPFCAQGQVGRDLLSQAEYAGDMQRNIGHQPGIARAMLANKHARQTAHMAAGLAQFLARRYAPGVVDDGDLDKIEAALVAGCKAIFQAMDLPLATTEIAGLVQIGRGLAITGDGCVEVKPDPATLAISSQGKLTALGGNLVYNEEVWILASGTFTAPVSGWYDVLTFDGGGNGTVGAYFAGTSVKLLSGRTGAMHGGTVHLRKGEEVEVIIGAGAPPGPAGNSASSKDGGATSFGNKTLAYLGRMTAEIRVYSLNNASRDITLSGIGLDGGYPSAQPASISQSEKNACCNAVGHFGGSGAVRFTTISDYGAGAGAQGSVRLRYWNPDKANG